ncbi:MAG: DegV family protein [Gaiellaceae bacterium]
MSPVALCTDSSALFPPGVAERLGVTTVPIAITLDGEPYDVSEARIDDFYASLSAGEKFSTSQPSPGDFLDAYGRAAASGAREVLSIHLDARVSGTASSAELAAREAPIPVTVVDTGTVSFGVGVCVRAAARCVAAGASATDAAVAARRTGRRLRNVFVAPAVWGGRVGDVGGWAVLEFRDRAATPLQQCENVEEAVADMARRVREGVDAGGPFRAAVGHAAAVVELAADALAGSLSRADRILEVERYRVGPAVGAHTGAFSFGAFWWPIATSDREEFTNR